MKKFISFFLFILTFQLSAFSQLGFVNSFNYVGYDTPALQDCPMKIGSAVTAIDDHNGNGVRELVFGDFTDDKYGYSNGAIWVAYITNTGFVDSVKRIDQFTPNFNFTINDSDQFGYSITTIGDLDGNGYTDLAVGAPGDDDGNWNTGAIYILFLDTNATLLNTKKNQQCQWSIHGLFKWRRIGNCTWNWRRHKS